MLLKVTTTFPEEIPRASFSLHAHVPSHLDPRPPFPSPAMAQQLVQIMGRHRRDPLPQRKPEWLKVKAPGGDNYLRLKQLMRELQLHTVCEEAHCPNIGECWQHGTATFMILGDVCTRNCAYCAVSHGRPPAYDIEEPARVAEAIAPLALRHAVITSVDRDDLPDFGAFIFAETIRQVRQRLPGCSIEVLVPDFQGNEASIRQVVEARPDIYNHNTETVPRLYKKARPGGRYERLLEIFRIVRRLGDGSVRPVSAAMSADVWWASITPAGAEP